MNKAKGKFVYNMKKMTREQGVRPECSILVDDQDRNIRGVTNAGFQAVQVDPYRGIQEDTANAVIDRLQACLNN